jgi:hypothetical protein
MENRFPDLHKMPGADQFGAPITRGFDLVFNHILDELVAGVGLFELGECDAFEIGG